MPKLQKMPKVTIFIFVIFVIFRALKLFWKVKKKTSNFQQMFYSVWIFHRKVCGSNISYSVYKIY